MGDVKITCFDCKYADISRNGENGTTVMCAADDEHVEIFSPYDFSCIRFERNVGSL